MKTIRIRPGHNKRIAYFGDGMGQVLEFRAEAKGDGAPAGTIEIKRKGLLGFKSDFQPLRPENRIEIGRLTHQISVSVLPEAETAITITRGVRSLGQKIRLAAGIVVVAGLALLGTVIAAQLGLLPPPAQQTEQASGKATGTERNEAAQ